jgi:hypothetical protein
MKTKKWLQGKLINFGGCNDEGTMMIIMNALKKIIHCLIKVLSPSFNALHNKINSSFFLLFQFDRS